MTAFRRRYHDTGPDKEGRRFFTLTWSEDQGVFRPESSKEDGKPVGYRRGQVFRTNPANQTKDLGTRGHTVIED